jgi:hypothetical protein
MTSNKQLLEKVKVLEQENTTLKAQLAELNENTVISSMNDMKERYEHLVENTVSIHKYESLKDYYKRVLQNIKTINTINIVNRENTLTLNRFLESYTKEKRAHYDEAFRDKKVIDFLKSILDRTHLIMEIYSRDDEEWDEYECCCEDD